MDISAWSDGDKSEVIEKVKHDHVIEHVMCSSVIGQQHVPHGMVVRCTSNKARVMCDRLLVVLLCTQSH